MSNDIRMITIDDDGVVSITSEMMDIPLSDKDAAIQRAVIALLNTSGSMADNPSFGGDGYKLYLAKRRNLNDTKIEVSAIVKQSLASIKNTERSLKNRYRISNMSVFDISRTSSDRGYNISIKLDFENEKSSFFNIETEASDVTS